MSASLEDLASRLRAHVETLAGTIGERNVFRPEGLAAARDYIETTWRAQGYEVGAQEYEAGGVICANLEVSRTGAGRAGEILVVGAHYDSVRGCPGANDNGSGVAALLEIARRFAGPDAGAHRPLRGVRQRGAALLHDPAAGQRGLRQGRSRPAATTSGSWSRSRPLATTAMRPAASAIRRCSACSIPTAAISWAWCPTCARGGVMRQVAKAFRDGSDFPLQHTATLRWIPGIAWSDHLPFWRQGYRALMATDTAFYRYRYYHTRAGHAGQAHLSGFRAGDRGARQVLCGARRAGARMMGPAAKA